MKRIGFDLIDALLSRLLVTKEGIQLVNEIRDGEPLEPRPRFRNRHMRGVHSSSLMGLQVWLNDFTLQSALLHELDDPLSGCLEYYSWPIDIGGVRYHVHSGARFHVDSFRPFLFKITEAWCGFVDVFPTTMLKASVASGRALYEEVDEGSWTSPPMVERLSGYGLGYQILTEKHFGNWHLKNTGLLRRYRQSEYKVQDPTACDAVVAMVKAKGYFSRRELIDRRLISADDLNYLIATRRVFFPIGLQDVTDMRTSAVFRDPIAYETFKAGKAASDGYLSLETPSSKPSSEIVSNVEPDFLQFVSPEAYAYAQQKLNTLSESVSVWWAGSGPKREGVVIPAATKAVWASQAELGELLYNNATYGLIPRWQDRGSRTKKYTESERLWDHVYLKHRLLGRKTLRVTHGIFTVLAERLHLPSFSEGTAKVRDRDCDRSIFVKFRDGSSARYAIAGFAPPGTVNRLFEATTPLFLAHIDHTPLSIRLENSANGRLIKCQVWLTVMVDAATGQKLAWTISLGTPNAASVATVLFECIDRNGCLPLFIVVDNAPEFDSLVMHRIMQESESHLIWRPAYHPRYGAPVEAANNKITVQILQQLAGNTVAVKNLYAYSRAFIARNPELMTLTQLNAYFEGIFDEVELCFGSARTGDEPVKDFNARRDLEVGIKYRKPVELTLSLRRLCMPPASNEGLRRVRDEGYVEVNSLAFFCEELKRFARQSVRVFPDVIHPGLVYVYVRDVGWYTAKSTFSDFFALYSKRELLGVIAELKRGPLRGVRDPVLMSIALAKKILELEQDPARKDDLARKFDRLMNRAPSLLKTEPAPDDYFNPPPDLGMAALVREAAESNLKSTPESLGGPQSDLNAENALSVQLGSKEGGNVTASNVVPLHPDSASSKTVLSDASKEGEKIEIIVRPSRLSF